MLHRNSTNLVIMCCAILPRLPSPAPMNDLLAALLLGIIEGITEFLPISSTGHLLIAERWLGHRSDLFNIAIQAGAILAVVLIYWKRLWGMLTAFFGLVGLHGLHVSVGGLWLATMMAQVQVKGFRREIVHRLICFNLFWHALDIVWIGIFTIVYLMGAAS